MKVAIVSGGIGKDPGYVPLSFVFNEAYWLAKRGIEVHVVRERTDRDEFLHGMFFHGLDRRVSAQAIKMLLSNIFHYPAISLIRNPLAIYGENRYAYSVVRVVKKNNINIVHAHFAYVEGWVGLLARKICRRPLAVTLHGYDILVEPSVGYGLRLSRRYDEIVRRVIQEADVVIVQSRAMLREVLRISGKGMQGKVFLVPHGVDVKRFNPLLDASTIRRRHGLEGRFTVFSLRSHRPNYGLEYLIRAIPIVLKRYPDVVFIIGGDGPLRPYHERLVEALNVRRNVVFTGLIPPREVPLYYAASDVVVVPSLQEAWGLVATEAMASGKPVIATRVGGLVDQVFEGHNGFLVPPRNPRAIAERIIYYRENPEEAKRMGMNGRRIAERMFDIRRRIDKLIKLYKELLH